MRVLDLYISSPVDTEYLDCEAESMSNKYLVVKGHNAVARLAKQVLL